MRTFVTMALIGIILLSSIAVAAAPEKPEWVQHIEYQPAAPDASAFFFRFDTENTRCIERMTNFTMTPGQPAPWIQADSRGNTIEGPDGTTIDVLSSSGVYVVSPRSPNTSHAMLNVGSGNVSIHEYSESGYDERDNSLGLYTRSVSCGDDPFTLAQWVSNLMTARVTSSPTIIAFYEEWSWKEDRDGFDLTVGNARGRLTFASESNVTFLRQLKDFDGTFSYNGDPYGTGLGPRAAGVNLELTLPTERGFIGGFLDVHPVNREYSMLSYQGPAGEVGAGSDVAPGSPVPKLMLLHIMGEEGSWRFRVHEYVAPASASSLLVWGADIETGGRTPNLDTLDADRDGLPDPVEYPICLIQNDNRPEDGVCPREAEYRDYQPWSALPSPRTMP